MAAETDHGHDDELRDLARRAAEGDRRAAGRYFQETLPWLLGAARRIAPYSGSAEHEDMVADAWVKLMAQWATGKGPQGNPRSYLAQTMRNAFTDRLRSPESRVAAIESQGEGWSEEFQVSDELAVRPAELHREAAILRTAFASLNPDFQLVLQRVLIDGVPPRTVAEELGKPSSAVSSQLNRAKHALRREVLIGYIAESNVAACLQNARLLPDRVKDSFEDHSPGDRGLAHVLTCAECRSAWARFASMTSALGVLPLLIWGGLTASPSPGAVLEPGASSSQGSSWPPQDPGWSSRASQEAARAVSDPTSWLTSIVASPWAAVAAVGAVLLGGASILASVIGPGPGKSETVEIGSQNNAQREAAPGDEPVVSAEEAEPVFEAWVELADASNGALELFFDIPGVDRWSVREVVLELPSGARFVSAPAELGCSGSSRVVCAPSVWPVGNSVRLSVASANGERLTGEFAATLSVYVPGSEQTVTATTAGAFPDPAAKSSSDTPPSP